MSLVCDSCKQPLDEGDGGARLLITDPTIDYRTLIESGPSALSAPRQPPRIDFCASCLVRLIEVLGLPPDTFTPRPLPTEPAELAADPPTGALTKKDLIALGLEGNDAP